jgi:hypothetical protein
MSVGSRKRGPSAAFIGVLVGIVASFIAPPRLKLSESAVVVRLMAGTVAGGMLGLAVDFLAARGRREDNSRHCTERMRKETAVHVAGVRGFFRGIKRSVVAAAVLLAWDGALYGSFLTSMIFCPIWFLVSLLKNAIERPGWGLALVRIGIPALTLGLVRANNAVQLGVAEANAQRVVAACEEYHAANGRFPKNLDELVPQYMNSVPFAKYCLGPPGRFAYYNSGTPKLVWQVVPPYYRKIYDFHTRSWSYLD